MTVTKAAKELQIYRVTLSKVLNGKAGITAGMALLLSIWLDGFSGLWKPAPVNLLQLKKLSWYQELYRRYSPATESRDWSHLLNQELITKSEEGFVKLNAFRI